MNIPETFNIGNNKIALLYLWLAIIIFGAANSITRKLTEVGSENLIDGRNPISFCNVLFVGNICALLMLLLIYHRQLTFANLRQISWQNWIGLSGAAVLSGALAPSLIFIALDRTTVASVILIGRLETPLALALSIWILKERVNNWTIVGAIVSFCGVVVTVFLQGIWQNMSSSQVFINVGVGEILVTIAAIALAISTIISKTRLPDIPLGIFSVFRTVLATVVFFSIVLYLYGIQHFMDVFSPFIWRWMLIYSAVIVVLGQLCWFTGLKHSSVSQVSLASSFNPVVGILAGYLILGEVPTAAQYIGGTIILFGIFLSQVGILQHSSHQMANRKSFPEEMSNKTGFKGI